MKLVDALGDRPDRRSAFSPVLLSETRDPTLEALVQQAALEVGAPIALVSLVLDHIQYFKAHHGLPADLAETRSTDRDVSFCQFVVRDELPFEVTDAAHDERVPQHVVNEYGISAYLGYPLFVGQTVIGSLCVLDTRAREFSSAEREALESLSMEVTRRINELIDERRRLRLELADELTHPALRDMQENLHPVFQSVSEGLLALPGLRAALKQYRSALLDGQPATQESLKDTLTAAEKCMTQLEESLHELDATSIDCADTLTGLELLSLPSATAEFTDVMFAAQDLARAATKQIGGARFNELPSGVKLAAPRPMVVAVLAAAISRTAEAARRHELRLGIDVGFELEPGWVQVKITCNGLPPLAFARLVESLYPKLRLDGSLDVGTVEQGLALRIPVLPPEES